MHTHRSLLAIAVLTISVAALAQTNDFAPVGIPQNSQTIPIPLGFIDPLTAQVHIEVPIGSVPQRNGVPIIAKMAYDWSAALSGWNTEIGAANSGYFEWDPGTPGSCPDPQYPNGGVTYWTNVRFVDLSGTVHPFAYNANLSLQLVNCIDINDNRDPNTGSPHSTSGGASDGSGYTFTASINNNGFLTSQVLAADGSSVSVNSQGGMYYGDLNGNTGGQFTTTPIGFVGSNGLYYFYVYASDGSKQTYTINYQTLSISNPPNPPSTASFLTSIVLPDQSKYIFTYDTGNSGNRLGMLTAVTLPTGGILQLGYTYTNYINTTVAALTSATYGGGTWNFSQAYHSAGGGNTYTTDTVTSPSRYDSASKTNVRDVTKYTSRTANVGPPYLQTASYYSGSSTLVKTVTITYTSSSIPTCIASVSTTLNDTGQTSQVRYSYTGGPGFCNTPTQIQEYDYGASSPTRTKKLTYAAGLGPRPASVSVYAGSGSGSPLSSRTYTYDEYSASYCSGVPMLTNITGAINHDDSGHGASWTTRGNVTSISRLVSGSTWVTSHKCYDTLGNVTQEVDEAGHATNYDYSETWADASCIASGTLTRAFPTTITDALGHRTKTTRFTCSTLSQAVADENDLKAGRSGTTYTYDGLGRPLSASYPDGGQTNYSYTATVPQSATVSTLISSSVGSKTTTSVIDGYGRISQSQLTSDPGGTDYTDMTYDAFSRVASVSNPYRSTSDSTYGITNHYYDALGRIASIIEPDGSSITTTYSGNSTTATDEAGKKRKAQTDALGRLTFIWEDPSGLNYETDYSYDALDNLQSVTQKGGTTTSTQWRTRTFTYDGLSRLVTASNPESGQSTYSYNNVGNLLSQISPAPNQTNSSVTQTVSYCYDALRRLTSKWYGASNCSQTSPVANYIYDQTSYNGLTIANGIGHRTGMSDGSGATAWSYDTMSRIAAIRRKINGIANTATFTYPPYVDGSVANVTYFSGSQIAYTYNTAEQAVSAIDPYPINFVKNVAYTPFGAFASETFGAYNTGFAGTVLTSSYNNRLQPSAISASSPTMTTFSLSYNFNQGSGSSPQNNGDAVTIQNNRDLNRTQNFVYDSLNRLSQAYTSGPNWGETFTIDAWGNLTNKSPVTGKTYYENFNAAPASTKNQLNGYCNDAAGNFVLNSPCPTGSFIPTYVYDPENRLIAAGGMSYLYDGDGTRVEKCSEGSTAGTCSSNASGTLYWAGLSGEILNESDLAASTWKRFVFFNGKMVARRDSSTGNVYYFYSDHLGSIGVVTDALGETIENESDYYPYGFEIPITTSLSDEHYKFTGKERDTESGLDFFGERHYASPIGRWMTPDPLNLTSARLVNPTNTLNKYVYGGNNPLKYIDRDGEDITIFYRPSSGAPLDFGHIMLGALNQDTGKVGFLDYYPNGSTNGFGSGPGAYNQGGMRERAEENAEGQFATLTIRTDPQKAQKVIDLIEALKNGPSSDYSALTHNCTTVCEDVLKDLGLDFGDILPSSYWADVYYNFSADALAHPIWTRMMGLPFNIQGNEYGNPRYDVNFSALLFTIYYNQLQGSVPEGTVTTSEEYFINCEKRPDLCE